MAQTIVLTQTIDLGTGASLEEDVTFESRFGVTCSLYQIGHRVIAASATTSSCLCSVGCETYIKSFAVSVSKISTSGLLPSSQHPVRGGNSWRNLLFGTASDASRLFGLHEVQSFPQYMNVFRDEYARFFAATALDALSNITQRPFAEIKFPS